MQSRIKSFFKQGLLFLSIISDSGRGTHSFRDTVAAVKVCLRISAVRALKTYLAQPHRRGERGAGKGREGGRGRGGERENVGSEVCDYKAYKH